MTHQKRKRKKPGGRSGPPPASTETVLADLKALLPDLGTVAGPMWGQVHKLLLRTDVDAAEVAEVVMHRDVEALERVVRRLSGDAIEEAAVSEEATSPVVDVPAETLKQAMRAFRKRLKLTRLDHESRISGKNPLTSGRKADFDAIMPPHEYPREVWDVLVAKGELKPLGSGFYMLGHE